MYTYVYTYMHTYMHTYICTHIQGLGIKELMGREVGFVICICVYI
jgi:hypothetical protein